MQAIQVKVLMSPPGGPFFEGRLKTAVFWSTGPAWNPSTFERQRQEDHKFQASLNYIDSVQKKRKKERSTRKKQKFSIIH
jgi:hypothetical protein